MIHSIGHLRPDPLNAWIEKRIFPGAYPPSLREMLEILEPCSFAVLDVENLRLHYALTLEHWLRRFDEARERVAAIYDEPFVRAWRLYLCGSQAAFRAAKCSSSRCCSRAAAATVFRGRGTTSTRRQE